MDSIDVGSIIEYKGECYYVADNKDKILTLYKCEVDDKGKELIPIFIYNNNQYGLNYKKKKIINSKNTSDFLSIGKVTGEFNDWFNNINDCSEKAMNKFYTISFLIVLFIIGLGIGYDVIAGGKVGFGIGALTLFSTLPVGMIFVNKISASIFSNIIKTVMMGRDAPCTSRMLSHILSEKNIKDIPLIMPEVSNKDDKSIESVSLTVPKVTTSRCSYNPVKYELLRPQEGTCQSPKKDMADCGHSRYPYIEGRGARARRFNYR